MTDPSLCLHLCLLGIVVTMDCVTMAFPTQNLQSLNSKLPVTQVQSMPREDEKLSSTEEIDGELSSLMLEIIKSLPPVNTFPSHRFSMSDTDPYFADYEDKDDNKLATLLKWITPTKDLSTTGQFGNILPLLDESFPVGGWSPEASGVADSRNKRTRMNSQQEINDPNMMNFRILPWSSRLHKTQVKKEPMIRSVETLVNDRGYAARRNPQPYVRMLRQPGRYGRRYRMFPQRLRSCGPHGCVKNLDNSLNFLMTMMETGK